ncbi:MAG: proprotein convertase P-domain-containing protein, partial [Luminiphilus sp.]|nr:proprotein convertase P-domain-containing protein [Luminiphilus sp.]
EIGHQFAGNHTYNGTVCTTGNPSTAYEPGSGSTIQAYAGICGTDNLQANSDPIFSAASFDEMIAYVEDGSGAGCALSSAITNSSTSTTNTAPLVNAGSDYTVPNNTPLILTGSATDADGDGLTYLWEQRDLGPKVALGGIDNGLSPLFRVWDPSTSPTRYLPKLATVVSGAQDTAEIMPSLERAMKFRLTARDSEGGVNSDDIVINVTSSNSLYPPFSLSEPSAGNESLGSTATVRWNVAQTNIVPISTDTIDFYLSTDSGASFESTPFTSKPNNGYARVTFPSGILTSSARLMIRGQNNIFYDVSDSDFTLNSDATATPETTAPVLWSLVPADGGAKVYFGEGTATGGSVRLYEANCRGELLEPYSKSASIAEEISESQPEVASSLSIDTNGVVPNDGLSLDLNIAHSYRGDLKITLTSPAGTEVTIKDSDYDSDDDVILDAYIVGGFAGETVQGNWTLEITDTYPQADDGTWISWGLSGNGRSSQTVAGSRDQSPISLSGMNNGWEYECDLTAYDNSVSPARGSQTLSAGNITPAAIPNTYTVSPSAGSGGSLSPDIALPVASGSTVDFRLSPDSGYEIGSVSGTCGGTLDQSTYVTSAITSNCTVLASFSTLSPGTPTVDRTDYGDGEILLYVSAGSGGAPTGYMASCSDGSRIITGTSASSPVTVTGLSNDTAYTCTVTASNNSGTSNASAATAAITPGASSGLPIWLLYQATQ